MKRRTIIVAAGDFPARDGIAWSLLANAGRVVCCDSAACDYIRNFKRHPDVIIGDLDSLTAKAKNPPSCKIIKIDDQNTNDLAKAIDYCHLQGWNDLAIVGATGKREDHTLGNIFRALESQIEVVTDEGTFHPVCGKAVFTVEANNPVSIFVTDPSIRMTSRGLKWPLDDIRFNNLYCATLNGAISRRFSVTSTGPVFVYIAKI